jgi:hypothetical protein
MINMINLLELDHCHAISTCTKLLQVYDLPSTFRKTFNANTLSLSSGEGLASLTSHTRANVPTAP